MMLFLPYYFEFLLKARGKFKPEWTGEVLKDGSLVVRDKLFSVPHVAISLLRKIKGSAHELEVVITILAFEVVVVLITIYSF